MTTTDNTKATSTASAEWPLTFKQHNFVAYCYDTAGCSVLYKDDYYVKDDEGKVTAPSSSYGQNYQKNWGGGAQLGINNFPSPAVVVWRSKDGTKHEAKVDIADIFRDQRILHNVPSEELPVDTVAIAGDPTIILEINNRAINVYMRAAVALKDTETRRSDFRDEVILAYSHTY